MSFVCNFSFSPCNLLKNNLYPKRNIKKIPSFWITFLLQYSIFQFFFLLRLHQTKACILPYFHLWTVVLQFGTSIMIRDYLVNYLNRITLHWKGLYWPSSFLVLMLGQNTDPWQVNKENNSFHKSFLICLFTGETLEISKVISRWEVLIIVGSWFLCAHHLCFVNAHIQYPYHVLIWWLGTVIKKLGILSIKCTNGCCNEFPWASLFINYSISSNCKISLFYNSLQDF